MEGGFAAPSPGSGRLLPFVGETIASRQGREALAPSVVCGCEKGMAGMLIGRLLGACQPSLNIGKDLFSGPWNPVGFLIRDAAGKCLLFSLPS